MATTRRSFSRAIRSNLLSQHAVAFSGFLFSNVPLLNQLGLFVVLSVLVDTFVVRSLLVPAVMVIGKR